MIASATHGSSPCAISVSPTRKSDHGSVASSRGTASTVAGSTPSSSEPASAKLPCTIVVALPSVAGAAQKHPPTRAVQIASSNRSIALGVTSSAGGASPARDTVASTPGNGGARSNGVSIGVLEGGCADHHARCRGSAAALQARRAPLKVAGPSRAGGDRRPRRARSCHKRRCAASAKAAPSPAVAIRHPTTRQSAPRRCW